MLQKQFDVWRLSTHLYYDAENKPYLDKETSKVIWEDAVTLKKKICFCKLHLKIKAFIIFPFI